MIIEIINFTNGRLKTPIAPSYKCSILGGYIRSVNLQSLATLILEKEKEITALDLPSDMISDGDTGLSPNSLTSRYRTFNVLTWDDHPEIRNLKQEIRFFYDQACDHYQIDKNEKVYIQCWANVLRKNEKMNIHQHTNDIDGSFLSGNIVVKCDNTQTVYQNPFSDVLNNPEYYYYVNDPGRISIFNSNIYHYTTEHKSDSERITIAFDIEWKKKPRVGKYIEF